MNQWNDQNNIDPNNSIAIIGMAGRFPDAATLEQFWKNLREGLDSVHPISDDELRQAGVQEDLIADSNYVKVASMLSDIDKFDADFFGVAAREAELMDPQHRLFLECSWEALEHAGYSPRDYDGSIGIFGGVAESAYLFENLASNPAVIRSMGGRAIMQVNQKDFLCGRVAYELNLRGPALVVQTACSTSLVAVHVACQSLLNGECDMALAGGVAISNLEKTGYTFVDGGIQSADGHCRAFDADATGIVDGSGVGIVLLKRLADAYADGDYIHAVVRGSAINNDGSDKISFTAPSVDRQAAAISEALSIADVTADTIAYVEAHGTGTRLGDPIEVRALSKAFELTSTRKQYCALGSVKTNLGHLDTAAGIAGLMKTVLSLQHRLIPPSLHFKAPNPHIDFASSPFYVNNQLGHWPDLGAPLRAGVSSFGVGGTNAHVVLEEAPARVAVTRSTRPQLLLLSAKTPTALSAAAANLTSYLASHPEFSAADISHTLMVGRQQFEYRRSVVCIESPAAGEEAQSAKGWTRSLDTAHLGRSSAKGQPGVVFMFPGGGTQYVGMGRSLYQAEPFFRQQIDQCAALAKPILQLDIRSVLFPEEDQLAAAQAHMNQLEVSLVALFSLEYALARQFMDWGVQPMAMIGHSLGEYVAACLAEVFSLPDALKVVAERGRLIGALPTANMLAVLLSPEQVRPWLGEGLWLACVNAQQACTIAGTPEATETLAARWTEAGVEFQFLRGWPASHSGLMAPILASFRSVMAGVELKAPQLPFLSNLSGEWITEQQTKDPDYWVRHLCNTVCFAQGVQKLKERQLEVFLELGPGHTLSNLVRRDAGAGAGQGAACSVIDSVPRQDDPASSLVTAMAALGRLWTVGYAVDWQAVYRDEPRSRVPLPTYPFERKRYWIGKGAGAVARVAATQHIGNTDPQGPLEPSDEGLTAPGSIGAPAALSLHARPDLPTEFVAPQSATERDLCAIWEALLGVGPIGVRDSFFALGGSSLIAIQLASRIRSHLGAEVPLRTLFRESTVAAQALEVDRMRAPEAERARDGIPRRAVTDIVPPSYSQQRLLFIDQLDHAADAAYHISKSIRIAGPLDRGLLKAALDAVVVRHEGLRTCFGQLDGQAVQVIGPASTGFALSEVDLGALPEPELAAAVQRRCDEEQRAPFSLAQGPLIRGLLLRLSDSEHILVVTQHHIISDGWSIGIMVRELSTLYEAFSQGQPDPLPPLPIQYADYAIWQRRWLQGEVLGQQTAYWKKQLSGAPALLELPTDRPRPAMQSYAGGHRPFEVSAALTAGLRQLSQRHGTTLFMTLLAAWAVLLSRFSGQGDIVVGTPVANRQRKETEGLIGFFVNTLALRVRIEGDPTVEQLLQQVKATTLDAYEHQDLPFEQVVEALQPQRSMSHNPIFQAMLNVHNTPGDHELAVAGLKFFSKETLEDTALCDLMLSIHIGTDLITADINYASALFDVGTVARMESCLQTLLGDMVADDQRRVGQLDLLGPQQRHELLEVFNATRTEYPRELLLHERFEAGVRLHPKRLALVCGDERLSYEDLNARANRLAHALRATGVRPDDRVAICMQRHAGLVVAVLAVLKAGGAYVPLDPAYPAERVAYMLSDCEPVAVLTQMLLQQDVRAALPIGVPMLVVDGADAAGIAEQDPHDPGRQGWGLAPGHFAYVIYTSGSTGQPKGVGIEHGNAVNFVHWGMEAFSTDELAVTLFSTSVNFDLHVFELFVPLSAGTAIRLVPDALTHDASWNDVTLINTVPSAMQSLLDHDVLPEALLCINLAGEPLRGALVDRAFAASRARRVVNLYGPSETTTYSTFVSMDRDEGFRPGIGRPVANTRVYILDASGAPVPLGVPGEIHIAGLGVARGYCNRAELTQQRFLTDPYGAEAGARMYKTGDLGRWLPDGTIEYLGRNDHQVKIRGFRIELGEIENRLLQCTEVREAVVVAREDQEGDKRLVAYLTVHAGQQVTAAALREALAHSLVEYMVPSAFVVLPELPLTPNGKIDRKALPAPDLAALASRTYEVPANELERCLAQIWQELLGVGRVGRHDNFFELGGHSLMAVRLLRRVEDECRVDLPMRELFERPVLRDLAESVQQLQFKVYLGEDIDALKSELGGLSESELLAMLEEDEGAPRSRVSAQLE
ncbi:amino acid adenylation domain-containing protein [Roseateles sp. SL47]|uniref:non-ribosomal peptide synthetase/type I polyketide synthase n=1 Tax=Roseateles sp. SL47 TaxID=2995138 RepID=UPI00226EF58A|nr:non-ribosomal peptide synthetase/type I polyketide synthase [Roseateles sp. SL47]WAC73175.1 amino acid adenylation domain-containing protein [Roseateles sp. SL47]